MQERETITEFEKFNRDPKSQRVHIKIEGCSEKNIIVHELEDFGHTYKSPKQILKLDILKE